METWQVVVNDNDWTIRCDRIHVCDGGQIMFYEGEGSKSKLLAVAPWTAFCRKLK